MSEYFYPLGAIVEAYMWEQGYAATEAGIIADRIADENNQ